MTRQEFIRALEKRGFNLSTAFSLVRGSVTVIFSIKYKSDELDGTVTIKTPERKRFMYPKFYIEMVDRGELI